MLRQAPQPCFDGLSNHRPPTRYNVELGNGEKEKGNGEK